MTDDITKSAIIRRAMEIVEEAWYAGGHLTVSSALDRGHRGLKCIMLALKDAALEITSGLLWLEFPAWFGESDPQAMFEWNDHPTRTRAEVLARLASILPQGEGNI